MFVPNAYRKYKESHIFRCTVQRTILFMCMDTYILCLLSVNYEKNIELSILANICLKNIIYIYAYINYYKSDRLYVNHLIKSNSRKYFYLNQVIF